MESGGKKLSERALEKIKTTEESATPASSLFLLKKHIFWFKKKKLKNFYQTLGTTEEEIDELCKKQKLDKNDDEKIQHFLKNAMQLKDSLLKKIGADDDERFIEKERKRHITKRFNIRDSWLQL